MPMLYNMYMGTIIIICTDLSQISAEYSEKTELARLDLPEDVQQHEWTPVVPSLKE
jgi:hypothetical protein